jgi:hypothetical protein
MGPEAVGPVPKTDKAEICRASATPGIGSNLLRWTARDEHENYDIIVTKGRNLASARLGDVTLAQIMLLTSRDRAFQPPEQDPGWQ